jgi:prepilin-type N-terminal cleavage/methylation domain-containing protein
MKLARNPRSRRGGFTLIELLVVLGIILILVSLTATAVMKFMLKGPELRARNDISGLANAVQTFQSDFKVDYLPSRIRLREDLAYDLGNANPAIRQYESDSFQYLKRLWPRLAGTNHNGTVGVDWNGDGVISANAFVDLEGDQCLVFFLGGIPINNGGQLGVQGFSADPTDPSIAPVPGTPRKGPYYDGFQSRRLVDRTVTPNFPGIGFWSYKDAYEKNVYAYFSSYKGQNGYIRYMGQAFWDPVIKNNTGSDCSTLGVSPYADQPGVNARFLNPNSFQIICAGRDGVFGRGSFAAWSLNDGASTWSPPTAGATSALWAIKAPNPLDNNATPANWNKNAGKDDMSNFYDNFLGIGR